VDDPDGAEISVRLLTPAERNDVASAQFDQRLYFERDETGKSVRTEQRTKATPQEAIEKTALYALTGWKYFFDEAGEPLKFNRKNILSAVRRIKGFADFIGDCLRELETKAADENKAQEKNSETS
jgi:hypothetical protein